MGTNRITTQLQKAQKIHMTLTPIIEIPTIVGFQTNNVSKPRNKFHINHYVVYIMHFIF